MPFSSVELNDGNEIPALAFGTGSVFFKKKATDYVLQAIETGFSHIDTAQLYENEESVGEAIRLSGLARDQLYVTTKYEKGPIRQTIRKSLEKLGLEYVDLYLIHDPDVVAQDFEGAWKEFEKIKRDGLAKSIGVSNFTLKQLRSLNKTAQIIPAVNQIRLHPYNYASVKPLLTYSSLHGITTEAYSSLTPLTKFPHGPVDVHIYAAAKRLGITPNQVLFLWAQAKGVVVVTTSAKKRRLEEYLAVPDLPALTHEEISAIDEAGAEGPPKPKLWVVRQGAFVCAMVLVVCIVVVFGVQGRCHGVI